MHADCSAAPAFLVHDGQARRSMLVKLPARLFHRLICATACGRGSHDLVDAHVGSMTALGRHAATYVPLRNDADQLPALRTFNHGRAAAA